MQINDAFATFVNIPLITLTKTLANLAIVGTPAEQKSFKLEHETKT
jgi:hypothetical protein